jgi:hypothetical protein
MGSIKAVVSEPIEGHEDYHMMVCNSCGTLHYSFDKNVLFEYVIGSFVLSHILLQLDVHQLGFQTQSTYYTFTFDCMYP